MNGTDLFNLYDAYGYLFEGIELGNGPLEFTEDD